MTVNLQDISYIEDVKKTGFYAGVKTCSLCDKETAEYPIRISWFGQNDVKLTTGYFHEECAREVVGNAMAIDFLAGYDIFSKEM